MNRAILYLSIDDDRINSKSLRTDLETFLGTGWSVFIILTYSTTRLEVVHAPQPLSLGSASYLAEGDA